MFKNQIYRSRILAVGLVAAFLLLLAPVREFAQAKAPAAPPGASLVGFVYDKDMKTPVANAVVRIWDVSSPNGYESRPTDESGMYKITGITQGRYTLEVTTLKGDFKFDYAMVLKASEVAKLSVALVPSSAKAAAGRPAAESTPAKSAATRNLIIGTVIIVAVGGMLAYALSQKTEASPVR